MGLNVSTDVEDDKQDESGADESEAIDIEDSSFLDEDTDGEEIAPLNFSWANLAPPKASHTVEEIVEEEAAADTGISFSQPDIVSIEQLGADSGDEPRFEEMPTQKVTSDEKDDKIEKKKNEAKRPKPRSAYWIWRAESNIEDMLRKKYPDFGNRRITKKCMC